MNKLQWLIGLIICIVMISCGSPTENSGDGEPYRGTPMFSDALQIQYDKEGIEFDSTYTITTLITPKFTMKGKYGIHKLNAQILLTPSTIAIKDSNLKSTGGQYFHVDFIEGERHVQEWKLRIPSGSKPSIQSYKNSGAFFYFFVEIDSVYVPKDTLRDNVDGNYLLGPKWHKATLPQTMNFFDRIHFSTEWFYIPFKNW